MSPPARRPGLRIPTTEAEEYGAEAGIAAHWRDEPLVPVPRGLAGPLAPEEAGVRARFAERGFPDAFSEYAELLTWSTPYHTVFDGRRPPFYRWFVGGRLNASSNCLDRHLAELGEASAIVFVPEPEGSEVERVSYRALHRRVNAFAAYLHEVAGVRAGDRVTLHLPMSIELPLSMLACARLGAVHSVVFGGYSAEACGRRIADSGSRVLVTMDGYWRGGRWVDHAAQAPRAIEVARSEGQAVDQLLVWERARTRGAGETPARLPEGGVRLSEELGRFSHRNVTPVARDSEEPLFLMYTSGTTGRPKGAQHGTGGYLAYAAGTTRMVLDVHPRDVVWCLADIGWITGHSYLVYGPLALGATTVLYEGVPSYPDAARPWRIAKQLGVEILYTSPTAIRLLRKLDPEGARTERPPFRLLGTVGEPIEPETWRWYYDSVGHREAAVVDTYWQTETGGIVCSTLPRLDPMKPGSAGPALPGIEAVVVDDRGTPVPDGLGRAGHLLLRTPWPGRMQTIWADPDRFVATYFARFNTDPESRSWQDWPYETGDAATRTSDGYLRILGRIDDVINVAGHRLGSKEIESACLTVPGVAEAAVVPVADPVKGRRPVVFVALRPGAPDADRIPTAIAEAIESAIGGIARPRSVHVIPEMPKTRSGKILRRVLAAIANGTDTGDLTTLADPGVVEEIRRALATGP